MSKVCTYCSSPFDIQRDHVIPSSFLRNKRKKGAGKDWIVLACKECNCLLGNKLLCSVPLRAEYLLKKYKRRLSRDLKRDCEFALGRISELERVSTLPHTYLDPDNTL